jgi:hypothetical protein
VSQVMYLMRDGAGCVVDLSGRCITGGVYAASIRMLLFASNTTHISAHAARSRWVTWVVLQNSSHYPIVATVIAPANLKHVLPDGL